MAFTVTPNANSPTQPVTITAQTKPSAARDRVVAKISALRTGQSVPQPTSAQVTDSPVLDQNHVTPEELSAITSSTPVPEAQQGSNEEPKAETTPPEEAAKPAAEQPALSAQFAQLARKEKALRAQVTQFKAEQAAFKAAQDAANAPKAPTFDPNRYVAIDDIQKDPFAALNKAGLSYEQLVEQQLNQPSPEQRQLQQTIQRQNEKLAELESKLAQVDRTFEQQNQNSYQQALTQIRTEAKNLVNSDPETFETIKATGSVKDVVDLIEDTWKNGLSEEYPKGTLLTVEQAAQMVEDHLSEEAYKLSQLKKIQKRFQPKPVAPATAAAQTPANENKQQPGLKTLTNAVGAQRQYTNVERATFAGKYGPNWREKVGA